MGNLIDDHIRIAAAPVPAQPGPRPARVLLVDDTPQNLLALQAMLGDPTLELVSAASGEEALRRLLQDDFAVILLDVLMPGMDGLETAALIRGRERSRDTPILFVTAAGQDAELVTRGYALGAVDYIVKPIEPVILRTKVAVFVELYRKAAQVREQAHQLARHSAELEGRVLARTVELHAARAAAEGERDRLRQVLGVLPEAVVITDASGRAVSSNAAASEILGQDPVGRPLLLATPEAPAAASVLHLDGAPVAAADLPLYHSLGGAVAQGAQLLVRQARDQRDVPILMNSAPLRCAEGHITGAVVVFQDISALKSLERQKDEFLASVSHDLRNPLTTISGLAQVLLRRLSGPAGVETDRLREGLATINHTTGRMTALLTELVDLTRLQLERPLDLDMRPTDLGALIRRVVAAHQQATERHTLRIHLHNPLDKLEACCDAMRIERVLGNLLSNAIKYSPEGGDITVALGRAEGPAGPLAILEVHDRGVGIPAEDLPHVFERFYRGRNVASAMQGSGVGLASVRQIVEQHGGAAMAARHPGGGTIITVQLPLAGPAGTALAGGTALRAPDPADGSPALQPAQERSDA